ncbi:MAG: hypothetical protein A3E01_00330 [Gammaproteobacteria bacterium RIFCSPHIGHO2_12_FULL_63_22]|nr:MAG: hypothetical protein A3E01_00330 [Gammaproteobacteria bacterium RIFCSPHIGHO2_12_FULL_63_22]
MKKILSFLALFGAVLAFAQNPVPVDTKVPLPKIIEPIDANGIGFAEKLFDFNLDNAGTATDTVIGNVFDIRKLAMVRLYDDSAIGLTNVVTMDSLLGQITISCFDRSDSADVTDSVAFVMNLQGSDFASNNNNPATPASDAWYTIRTFTMLNTSAASAQVTTDTLKVKLPLAIHSPQFIRVHGSNLSTVAQNDMRCRVFIYRQRWLVQ